MTTAHIEIRDQREKEWYWTDNEFIDAYGEMVGGDAVAVYSVLCRHANNDSQSCFPSMETIARKAGLKTRKKVGKAIHVLEDMHIIETEKKYEAGTGIRQNNVYHLLGRNQWKPIQNTLGKVSWGKKITDKNVKVIAKTIIKKLEEEVVPLPDWLNRNAWEAWIAHRKDLKRPMKPTTIKIQLKFLSEHQKDHAKIIKQAIISGWTGLFPLKEDKPAAGGTRVGDMARAHQKRIDEEEEKRAREESSKNNDAVRDIGKMSTGLADSFRVKE